MSVAVWDLDLPAYHGLSITFYAERTGSERQHLTIECTIAWRRP